MYTIHEGKKWNDKQKRKLIDYFISSQSTQQKRRKKLLDTVNLLAGSAASVPKLVHDVFNIEKTEENVLSENISNTLKIVKKYFSPVQHKRIGCLLTDKLSLDRAVELTGINNSSISKYRNLKNKNGDDIFAELKNKRINENYTLVLDSWGEMNVVVISGKYQKRMSQKCWKENYNHFSEFYIRRTGEEIVPSFDWFRKQTKQRRWLRINYNRYRCSIFYLGKKAAKLKYQHNKSDEDMMAVSNKNGFENEKKNIGRVKRRRKAYSNS